MNYKLINRFDVTGILAMKTGLHLGGSSEGSISENSVIREANGRPFIPGSSFKGVLRSTIEKILPNFTSISGVWSCQLFEESDVSQKCPTNKNFLNKLKSEVGKKIKDSEILNNEYKQTRGDEIISESFVLNFNLPEHLCDTCKLFGSPILAAKIKIQDLHIREPYFELSEIRDGVGIDRDTEVAVDRAKFDFEVIPSQTEFDLKITLENVSDKELAIFALGLNEFIQGNATIGGLTSRGLGACKLEEGYSIRFVDFTNPDHLQEYILNGKMSGKKSFQDLANLIKIHLLKQ